MISPHYVAVVGRGFTTVLVKIFLGEREKDENHNGESKDLTDRTDRTHKANKTPPRASPQAERKSD